MWLSVNAFLPAKFVGPATPFYTRMRRSKVRRLTERCMVKEDHYYTSKVRLFVMNNSRSGSLTNKIG